MNQEISAGNAKISQETKQSADEVEVERMSTPGALKFNESSENKDSPISCLDSSTFQTLNTEEKFSELTSNAKSTNSSNNSGKKVSSIMKKHTFAVFKPKLYQCKFCDKSFDK